MRPGSTGKRSGCKDKKNDPAFIKVLSSPPVFTPVRTIVPEK
jgi:hypothetical protein